MMSMKEKTLGDLLREDKYGALPDKISTKIEYSKEYWPWTFVRNTLEYGVKDALKADTDRTLANLIYELSDLFNAIFIAAVVPAVIGITAYHEYQRYKRNKDEELKKRQTGKILF